MARGGRHQANNAGGFLVIIALLATSPFGISATRQLQDATESPFCGSRDCEKAMKAPYCNAKPSQCTGCGGKWCTAATSPTPPPSPVVPSPAESPFCGSRDCQNAMKAPYCNAKPSQCTAGCGGKWCTAAPISTPPPVVPSPSPVVPSPAGSPFCGTLNCQKKMKAPWCNAKLSQCTVCSGQWCTAAPTPTPPPVAPTKPPVAPSPTPSAPSTCSEAPDKDTCKALSGCDWGKNPGGKGKSCAKVAPQAPGPTPPTGGPTPVPKPPTGGPTPGPKPPTGGSPPSSCRGKSSDSVTTRTAPMPELQTKSITLPSNSSWDDDETRIVGGTPAIKGRYPYMVNIAGKDDDIFCGGSLISPSVVLSAAHCDGGIDKVFIGRHDLKDGSEVYEEIEVDRTIPHPKYKDKTSKNDFMIITLKQKSSYLPVVLDSPSSSDGVDLPLDSEGLVLTVMGWGDKKEDGKSSPVLLEAAVAYVPNAVCDSLYFGDMIFDDMICAASAGKDSCQGDSGGPLIVKTISAEEDVQVGVVSWGYGCANKRYPGVYARVSKAHDWIKEQVENVGESLAELCRDDAP